MKGGIRNDLIYYSAAYDYRGSCRCTDGHRSGGHSDNRSFWRCYRIRTVGGFDYQMPYQEKEVSRVTVAPFFYFYNSLPIRVKNTVYYEKKT